MVTSAAAKPPPAWSSICLSPSPWRPISATLSSTRPDSMPQKLRGHDKAMCHQLEVQLWHTGRHGSVSTGPRFHGVVVTRDPSALTDRPVLHRFPGQPGLSSRSRHSTGRSHQSPKDKEPTLVTIRGFPQIPHMPSYLEPHTGHSSQW